MPAVTIRQAALSDVAAMAALFTECFGKSVRHYCGSSLPRPQAMEDIFRLVYKVEPEAAFVAEAAGRQVVGYCFAPACLPRLWIEAVTGGYIFLWFYRWVTGRYGLGLRPLKTVFFNKASFLQSSLQPQRQVNARILSIAVSESWRGQGIAGGLMAAAMNYFAACRVDRVRLEVRPDNHPALQVYQRWGFVPAGVTRDSQGEWLIMLKEMEG